MIGAIEKSFGVRDPIKIFFFLIPCDITCSKRFLITNYLRCTFVMLYSFLFSAGISASVGEEILGKGQKNAVGGVSNVLSMSELDFYPHLMVATPASYRLGPHPENVLIRAWKFYQCTAVQHNKGKIQASKSKGKFKEKKKIL